jgi:DNA (cytosine-5)-methyltransferase 1
VETFRLNFQGVPVWERNIRDVSGQEILDFCKIKKGDLDVFDGSPPCQGFSMAGKRNVNDLRNDLFQEFVRLIDELAPKVFVMENVAGMVRGKMKGRFIEIMKALNGLDYNVKCKLMNAKYYNVPQSRPRLIWIGVRKDLKILPSFPEPNHQIIKVSQALSNLKIVEKKEIPSKSVIEKVLLRCSEGENGRLYNNGNFFNWQRIDRNKLCPTITKTACLFHWNENRYLTIQELKRLATFPDDFQFVGSHRKQWARIGNAVMPNFMFSIAKHIKENILNHVS